MCRSRGLWGLDTFRQPGNGGIVILRPKQCSANGKFSAWVVGLQLKIFLKERNSLGRVMPKRSDGTHCVIERSVFRFELKRFLKSVARFGQKLQVQTDQPKIIVNAGILRRKIQGVSEVTQRTFIIALLVGNSCQFPQQSSRKIL